MPQLGGTSGDGGAMRLGELRGLARAAVREGLELGVRHAPLLLVVVAVGLERGELALPRRVVHQRSDPHQPVALERHEALDAIRRRHLAAQVDVMLGAQPPGLDTDVDGGAQPREILRRHAAVVVEPDAQRVEHRGDPGSRDLRVMRLQRRERVPAHAGARRVVALHVVGVKLDEARQQIVALEVDAAGKRRADIGDPALLDLHRTQDHFVPEHDAGIGEDQRVGHVFGSLVSRQRVAEDCDRRKKKRERYPALSLLPLGHSRESGNLCSRPPPSAKKTEIPAFAGMTRW